MRPVLALSLFGLAVACAAPSAGRLGRFHRPITTSSPAAQAAFDDGLLLCYAFNHEEAVHRFEAALQADPECAMAWWGIAYALGPNINFTQVEPPVAQRAQEAAANAARLQGRCQPVEQALIAAMGRRYAAPPPADRAPLDRAFAEAMRDVHARFPADADAGAICAEALLDLSPWDQWTADGQPKANTLEVLDVLRGVLKAQPDHPQAIHLLIHATEASPHPEEAAEVATRLPALAPSCGHLVHMPSHTWVRLGRYRDAVRSNLVAIDVDHDFLRHAAVQGIYPVYLAHNQHMAAYAAMFLGDSATALRCAREMVADLPPAMLAAMPQAVDGFLAVPLHVLLRFGRWQEVLAEPAPKPEFPVCAALRHYARGVALANLDRLDEAAAEQAELAKATAALPADAAVGLTPAAGVLAVAKDLLAGELTFRRGDRAAAFAALRRAVATEDGLRYDEPPGWMMPVRHALGALLLEAGDAAAAAQVYRDDLARHPDNGWSLHGLAECQRRLQDPAATATEAAFQRAWRHADVTLTGSCYCRRQ